MTHSVADILVTTTVSEQCLAIIRSYAALERRLLALGLDGVWELRPLLDGNQLMTSIGLQRGPMVGKIMEAQLRWQLHNPQTDAATVEKCAAYLQEYLKSLS